MYLVVVMFVHDVINYYYYAVLIEVEVVNVEWMLDCDELLDVVELDLFDDMLNLDSMIGFVELMVPVVFDNFIMFIIVYYFVELSMRLEWIC